MAVKYRVEQMVNWQNWRQVPLISDGSEYEAANLAKGLATHSPLKRVRMLKMEFENGKIKSIEEYGVNPPWWNGNPKIPPRGAEIYLRGTPELYKL